jgi:hypothetical protein
MKSEVSIPLLTKKNYCMETDSRLRYFSKSFHITSNERKHILSHLIAMMTVFSIVQIMSNTWDPAKNANIYQSKIVHKKYLHDIFDSLSSIQTGAFIR